MKHYKIYTTETASAESLKVLDAIIERRGFVPNVYAAYGAVSHSLEGFAALTSAFGASSLTPPEREIVLLATSVHNRCSYCVAGHSYYSKEAGLASEDLAATREGRALFDPKLEALRQFATALAARRGRECDAEMSSFLAAGFTQKQALEVINGVALKTMSNMTANLLELPLDPPFAPFVWTPSDAESMPTG